MALLQACLWCLVEAEAVTFPATVEIDLIFPHNDTYAPSPLMPIVFAFQNSRLAAPLDPGLHYQIVDLRNASAGPVSSGILDLQWANFTSSDPYFAFDSASELGDVESTWSLSWTLASGNCSGSPDDGTVKFSGRNQDNSVIFTTKNGSPKPDLVAATSDGTCAHTEGYSFNVTGVLDVPPGGKYDGRNSCAILSPVSPTLKPCGAKVDAAAASSISAAITATACAGAHPVVSCPPNHNAAPRAMQFPAGGAVWLAAILTGISFLFIATE